MSIYPWRQVANPGFSSDSQRTQVDLQKELLTTFGKWVDRELDGDKCFLEKRRVSVLLMAILPWKKIK